MSTAVTHISQTKTDNFYEPINWLLNDLTVTEIIINSPQEIFYEKESLIQKNNFSFDSDILYTQFIRKLCSQANTRFDLNAPHCSGQWKNFRLHLVSPPITKNYTKITLRRIKNNGWSLDELQQNNFLNRKQHEHLKSIFLSKNNILIIGPTGTGKTSLVNALLKLVPENERVICLEDTDEIKLPNNSSIKMLTRIDLYQKLKNYTLTDLLIQTLRMRPDRIVLGEVRGSEAKDLLMAFSTGHRGGASTLHADSPQQALWRLEMLIQMGAPSWSTDGIRRLIKLGIDYIVTIGFDSEKQRQLQSIHKIQSLESSGFTLRAMA